MSQAEQRRQLHQDHRCLAAFDFDYTVVDQNTDTVVRDLLSPEKINAKELTELMRTGWTAYMAEVFRQLHLAQVSPRLIRETIARIPEVPGLARLIKRLYKVYKFDLIVISDSNSVFIEEWLKTHGLAYCFKNIFTNPAEFAETGQLQVRPYHHQTDCKISAPNLCKGRVLEHFVIEQDLKQNIYYDHVFYMGDGNNDICPMMRLRSCDFACARRGYAIEKYFTKHKKIRPRAELLYWNNGFDLLEQMEAKSPLQKLQVAKTEIDAETQNKNDGDSNGNKPTEGTGLTDEREIKEK